MEPGSSGATGTERMPVMVEIKVLIVIEISTFVAPPRVIVPIGRVAIRSVIARGLRASSQPNHREKRDCQQDRCQFFHRSDAPAASGTLRVKRRCLCNQAKRPPRLHL